MPKQRKRKALWALAGGAAVLMLSGAGAVACPTSPESKKFSMTKTLTVAVR